MEDPKQVMDLIESLLKNMDLVYDRPYGPAIRVNMSPGDEGWMFSMVLEPDFGRGLLSVRTFVILSIGDDRWSPYKVEDASARDRLVKALSVLNWGMQRMCWYVMDPADGQPLMLTTMHLPSQNDEPDFMSHQFEAIFVLVMATAHLTWKALKRIIDGEQEELTSDEVKELSGNIVKTWSKSLLGRAISRMHGDGGVDGPLEELKNLFGRLLGQSRGEQEEED